jgi:multidrug efflux pump
VFVVYALLLAGTGLMFKTVPGGFIPTQDKLYLVGGVKMPEGASLSRTDAMIRQMSAIALQVEGVQDAVAFPGLNALQFTNTPNTGTVFFVLKPHDERKRGAPEITAELNQKFHGLKGGFAFAIMPPPILGLGQGSGYSLFIQDRAGLGYGQLQQAVGALSGAVSQTPGMSFPDHELPGQRAAARRTRRPRQGQGAGRAADGAVRHAADLSRLGLRQRLQPLRTHLPGDRAGRRGAPRHVEDIANLRTRNLNGQMVPIGSMVTLGQSYGPDPVMRYNGYPAADLIGEADPRVLSSAEAMARLKEMAPHILPNGMSLEWTDLSFQQATQGNAALVVFPLAVLLAFLVLAALYESWTLPLAVILIVPMTLLSALFGVWLTGGDNNVFVQVGLVVLMGLACKNAILIVEFARELELGGMGVVEAALEACRLRLRPIVMTSIAFIAAPCRCCSAAAPAARCAR